MKCNTGVLYYDRNKSHNTFILFVGRNKRIYVWFCHGNYNTTGSMRIITAVSKVHNRRGRLVYYKDIDDNTHELIKFGRFKCTNLLEIAMWKTQIKRIKKVKDV